MPLIDGFSRLLHRVSMALLLLLIAVMMTEVVARYAFNAPTMWAADMSYMLNGALFMMAAGHALHMKGHVQIDFLAERMPAPLRNLIMGVGLLGLCAPVLGAIGYVATTRAIKSFVTGEIEPVSIWQPVIWPFHAAIAVGLWAVALQSLVEGIRHFAKLRG